MNELYRKKSKWTHPTFGVIREVTAFEIGGDDHIRVANMEYRSSSLEHKLHKLSIFFRSSVLTALPMKLKKNNILHPRELRIAVIFLLIIFVSLATAATPPPQKSLPTSSDKDTTIARQEKLNMTINIFLPLVSAVLGGLAGAGISIYYSRRQAKQEYRSLILSFCSEMVSIFWRCVKYYKQSKTGEISYSALFTFTDSSTLSKFASVCKKPEVVAAIVELKSMYFQV